MQYIYEHISMYLPNVNCKRGFCFFTMLMSTYIVGVTSQSRKFKKQVSCLSIRLCDHCNIFFNEIDSESNFFFLPNP